MGRAGGGVGDEHHGKEEKAGAAATKIRLHRDRTAQAHFSMLFLSLARSLAEAGGPHLS